jgi:hypothetical protein
VTVIILGVPTNSSGRTDGVARAPAVLRESDLSAGLGTARPDVVDLGDDAVDPPTGIRDHDEVID